MSIDYSAMEECLECGTEYDPNISEADNPERSCSTYCENEYFEDCADDDEFWDDDDFL